MKKIVSIISICFIIISCHKDQPVIYNHGVLGKWELTEYYVSIGGPANWQAADDNTRHTIEFQSNGDFISNANLYYGANGFEISDSISIKFLNATQIGGELHYNYNLEENNSLLTISPLCFEGCAYKYKAIK